MPHRKRVLLVVLASLSPWLFYLLVANLVIATPVLRMLTNRNPDHFILDYGSAYTLWPTRVHVRRFHLQYQNPKYGFDLDIDEATAQVELSALLRRRFHAHQVRASGVSYRILKKGRPLDERTAAFPPIPGITPLAPIVKQLPSNEPTRFWTVELTDTRAELKEVWVLEYRWRGRGRVSGAFELEPKRHVWVGPCVFDLDPGLLTAGRLPVSTDFAAHGTFTMADVDIPDERRIVILRAISARVQLEATVQHLEAALLYRARGEGHGQLAADLVVDHGRFTQGSHAGVHLQDVQGRASGYGFDGEVLASAWVDDGQPHVQATATGDTYVPVPFDETLKLHVPRAELDVLFSTSDLTYRWHLPWLHASAERMVAEDGWPFVAGYRKRWPVYVPFLMGRGPLTVNGAEADGSLQRLRVHLEGARLGDVSVSNLDAVVGQGRPIQATLDGQLSAVPFHVEVEDGHPSVRLFGEEGLADQHHRVLTGASMATASASREDGWVPRATPVRTTRRGSSSGETLTVGSVIRRTPGPRP